MLYVNNILFVVFWFNGCVNVCDVGGIYVKRNGIFWVIYVSSFDEIEKVMKWFCDVISFSIRSVFNEYVIKLWGYFLLEY